MPRIIELKGLSFGRLTVLSKYPKLERGGGTRWVCQCSCGNIVTKNGRSLRDGATKSCGCLKRLMPEKVATESGAYRSWRAMLARCYSKNTKSYLRYGGRGIRVCKRWRYGEDQRHPFFCFLADMGERPENMTLDRKKNHMNYTPANCRWATATQQARNRAPFKHKHPMSVAHREKIGLARKHAWQRQRDLMRDVLDGKVSLGSTT